MDAGAFERASIKLAEQEKKRQAEARAGVNSRTTLFVVFACFVSATSGFLYGYDGGITGGVSNMYSFQAKFFPGQVDDQTPQTYYCKHNDQMLQLFASSLYFAGAAASIPGAHLSKRYGRTFTMTVAGTAFLIGSVILAGAVRRPMLILGRIFWGVGIGFADQAATIYSSEMAPPHLRGTLTMLFQLCTVTGILLAQCLNIATHYIHPFGWRISLGLAAAPGAVLLVGGLLLPETPNSLIERGYLQRGRAVLEAIRGTADVDAEYGTIVRAYQREKGAGDNQYRTLLSRELRPHLTLSLACPFFQQWTGINSIVFFSPFIFQSMGGRFQGELGSLLASVIVGAVQELGILLGIAIVDRVGRRALLIQSTVQSVIAQIVLAIVLAVSTDSDTVTMGAVPARASIILICVFVFGFGYGWGPMGWVISSEIQPLQTRCLGQGLTVCVSLISGAVIGQSFLTMLCKLEWGVYLLFASMQLLAIAFCVLLLPETTGIPIEMVSGVFSVHWFWKRFTPEGDPEGVRVRRELLALLERRRAGKASSKRLLDFGGGGKAGSPRGAGEAGAQGAEQRSSSPGSRGSLQSRGLEPPAPPDGLKQA